MFGIGMGPSKQENQQYNNLSGSSSWASNQGMQDITASTDFMKAILSGDPTKIGEVLGPQIKAIQEQGVQQKATNTQFHNRGGGTNATNQRIGDNTRSSVNDLISSVTGSAVSGLNSTGQNLFTAGQSGFGVGFDQAKTMHDQNMAKWNDIFKSSLAVAGGVMGGIGNLDTLGTSTGGEQFVNFMTGFGK
jgi:hypothetical protein